MHKKQNTRLAYKYRSGDANTLSRDLKSLDDATFYAANRHALNDPFEGCFNRAHLDNQFSLLKKLTSSILQDVSKSLDEVSYALNDLLAFVDKCGVFSLSHNPLQELIWAHCGGSHCGFCIGYDTLQLIDFEPNSQHLIDVKYGDEAPTLRPNDLLMADSPVEIIRKMLGKKSKPWEYEEEVRIITQSSGLHEHDYRAVKAIYFGLRCSESTKTSVMETLAGRNVSYYQVINPEASYVLKAKAIPDQYASAQKYKQNFAPIIDGAIYHDYLKPELKQYASYLPKAAEIIRREPYCQEIQVVDFSRDRSTPNNPIIYVQYLRSPNKYINHYLSLSEIEKQYVNLGLSNNT